MSDGFQVIMTDLQQAAGVFRTEAGTFAAIMPATGPVSVDGGGAEINDALSWCWRRSVACTRSWPRSSVATRTNWRPPTAPTGTPKTPLLR